MRLIKGLVIIFGCLLAGEFLAGYIPLTLPGNVIGMVLLFAGLSSGMIALEDVDAAGELFLDNLILLFVPLSVGIMRYFDLLAEEILSVVVVGLVGYLLLFLFSGKLVDLLNRGDS